MNRVADKKIIIAHRGASGYLPEHTLEGYAMAYAMGADFIEPDLVISRDGVLICLHDIYLESTTNVQEMYPHRHRIDGRWYAADFTVEEIKKLKAQERLSFRFRRDSQGFQIPTFEELIQMVQELNRLTGRDVGIYPETKAPGFHDREGLSMEVPLINMLTHYRYLGKNAHVFIQSFDPHNLKEIRFELGSDLPLVQLISESVSHDNLVTEKGLDDIAAYAHGIGPDKRRIEDSDGHSVNNNALVNDAHARGLVVHPYTFRREREFLLHSDSNLEAELKRFYYEYGVDGLFTDHTDIAVKVVNERAFLDTDNML